MLVVIRPQVGIQVRLSAGSVSFPGRGLPRSCVGSDGSAAGAGPVTWLSQSAVTDKNQFSSDVCISCRPKTEIPAPTSRRLISATMSRRCPRAG